MLRIKKPRAEFEHNAIIPVSCLIDIWSFGFHLLNYTQFQTRCSFVWGAWMSGHETRICIHTTWNAKPNQTLTAPLTHTQWWTLTLLNTHTHTRTHTHTHTHTHQGSLQHWTHVGPNVPKHYQLWQKRIAHASCDLVDLVIKLTWCNMGYICIVSFPSHVCGLGMRLAGLPWCNV